MENLIGVVAYLIVGVAALAILALIVVLAVAAFALFGWAVSAFIGAGSLA